MNLGFNKEFADLAEKHLEYLKTLELPKVRTIVGDCKLYDESDIEEDIIKLMIKRDLKSLKEKFKIEGVKIEVKDTDSISAVLQERKRCVCLNFADFKHAGGRFMDGSTAQEECLCHCTNLYPELNKYYYFYDKHSKQLNRGMYNDDFLLLVGCSIVKDCNREIIDPVKVDILTCAMPNCSNILRYTPELYNGYVPYAVLERTRQILEACCLFDNRVPILGSAGCGVFKNDPTMVAMAFYYNIAMHSKGRFDRIVFAIPNKTCENYIKFSEVLSEV